MKTIKFKSFSSGSCGNCYFIGIFEDGQCLSGVLVDAGVSPRRVRKELQAEGLDFDDFGAILVTHDHLDHIRSLGSYCKHVCKPVWATPTLVRTLSRHFMTGEFLGSFKREFKDQWEEVSPGIKVHWFEVPHDATQTVGFAMMLDGFRYVHITDCGCMTEEAMNLCRQADAVTIESNYDPDMLANGPYPPDLQQRIRGGHGHMSNGECADAVAGFCHEGLKYVFLCHLSEHNNTPKLAVDTCRKALESLPGPQTVTVRVVPLPRQTASPIFNL